MDTEAHIFNQEKIEELLSSGKVVRGPESIIRLFDDLVESVRHFFEIGQLLDSYLFNFYNLHYYYKLFFSDYVQPKFEIKIRKEINYRIPINTLTNNLVSSSITLLNCIEVFIKELSEKEYIEPWEEIKKAGAVRLMTIALSIGFYTNCAVLCNTDIYR